MRLFRKKEDQDEKLIRNIKRYEQKKKAEQSKSQILGQKLVKETKNKKESTSM